MALEIGSHNSQLKLPRVAEDDKRSDQLQLPRMTLECTEDFAEGGHRRFWGREELHQQAQIALSLFVKILALRASTCEMTSDSKNHRLQSLCSSRSAWALREASLGTAS